MLLLYLAVIMFEMQPPKPYPKSIEGKVMEIIDGDSFTILDTEDNLIEVSFRFIDAPESDQEGNSEAISFLKKRLLKRSVDVYIHDKDRRGNLRVSITHKKQDLEKEMLKNGLAWVLTSQKPEYSRIERDSRNRKVGIWGSANPIEPWIWRRNITNTRPKGS